jgi:hypothetical protein
MRACQLGLKEGSLHFVPFVDIFTTNGTIGIFSKGAK